MTAAAADVIAGKAVWAVEQGDCLEWMRSLPDGCCSLAVTSPPYCDCRTYSIGFDLSGDRWVDWMAPRVVEACRVTNGLVCVNMAGPVKNHAYLPVVEWLVAELTLHCGLVCGPSPYVYFRFGIPGSGGARYHRRDWEPVYCFCQPEVLPLTWSDNTAEGHPPKWAPGGEMSNRLGDGTRVNQWGAASRTPGHGRGQGGEKRKYATPGEVRTSNAEAGDATPGLFGAAEDPAPARDKFGFDDGHEGPRRKSGRRDKTGRPSRGRDDGAGKEPEQGLFGEVEEVEGLIGPNGERRKAPKEIRARTGGTELGQKDTGRKASTRRRMPSGEVEDMTYEPPVLANPGNVVRERYPYIQRIPAEDYIALPEFLGIIMLYGKSTKTHAGTLLYDLREALGAQAVSRWFRGVYTTVLGQAVLRPDLYGFGRARVADLRLPGLSEAVQAAPPWAGLLQRCLSLCGAPDGAGQPESGTQGQPPESVRPLRINPATLHPPQGRDSLQQRQGQFGSSVPVLSQQAPPAEGDLLSLRETADGARVLSETFAQIQDVWRSAYEEAVALARSRESGRLDQYDAEQVRELLEQYATRQIDYGDVIRCLVGGGQMGSPLAHENEAPFPERLAEFFVRSYAPPGSVVLDFFSGSGTTPAVAVRLGRRALGCDVRASQVALARRRVGGVTPDLFGGQAFPLPDQEGQP